MAPSLGRWLRTVRMRALGILVLVGYCEHRPVAALASRKGPPLVTRGCLLRAASPAGYERGKMGTRRAAMDESCVMIRYMDLFHPVEAPEDRPPYSHFAEAARTITEELGCEDGQRSHFEVRYRGRRFYVYLRSPHLPLEHHEHLAGLRKPHAYEFRVSLQDLDGTWMWLELPGMTGQETPSRAFGQAVELISRWVDEQ